MTHARAPQPFTLQEPLDYEDAREAGKLYAKQRRDARENLEAAINTAKEKITAYRKAYALAFVSAQGDTAEARKADAQSRAADAEAAKWQAEQMVKVAHEKLAEIDGHRATFHRLVEWSKELDPTVAEIRAQRRTTA